MGRSRKQVRKSRHIKFVTLICVLILLVSYSVAIAATSIKPIQANILANPIHASGELNVTWPDSQEAAVGVLGYGPLAQNGDQTPSPTASIAKLVTSLVVLEKYPLSLGEQGPMITITQSDVDDYNNFVAEDGSVVKVVAGEQISEYQAIQAMMLPSANNMADTLAIWAYGSIPNYVNAANIYVKSLKMDSTTISDPSGFSPNTVSTSLDLVRLGEASLYNPVLAQIVSQPSAIIPVVGLVKNVDYYLGQYNLIGIKTGNTDQAGGTFLSAAKYDLGNGNDIIVIGAVMKTQNLSQALTETIPMLESVKDQLALKNVSANTKVVEYNLPWSNPVYGVTSNELEAPYLPSMPIGYVVRANTLSIPTNINRIVGSVTFSVGNDKSSTTIKLFSQANKPSYIWKLFHPQYVF